MGVLKYKPKAIHQFDKRLAAAVLRSENVIRKSQDVIRRSNRLLSQSHQELETASEAIAISKKIRRKRTSIGLLQTTVIFREV